jgi:hypothetical protein
VTASDPGPATLAALEARLRRDFALLTLAKDWLEPRTHPEHGPVLDVAIVGAGMAGLSAAFALKCVAVRALRVFDGGDAGFEGPWATYARMETLLEVEVSVSVFIFEPRGYLVRPMIVGAMEERYAQSARNRLCCPRRRSVGRRNRSCKCTEGQLRKPNHGERDCVLFRSASRHPVHLAQ